MDLKNYQEKIGLFTGSLDGHRKSYLDFVLTLLPSIQIENRDLITFKSPVFFLMVEDSFLLYFVVSLFRAFFGRKTVGLLFRPKPVAENKSLKLKIKRWALLLLKQMKNIQTLLILPEETHPGFSEIADGWIYDFQLWDLQDLDYQFYSDLKSDKVHTTLFSDIKKAKENKKVVCALGGQDRIKGFDVFASSYIENSRIQEEFLFAYGGKVKGLDDLAETFEKVGGFSENRFVSDDDLMSLYASADLVWTLYAADYDQASGIFGRAVQLGIPMIVRKGSLIHQMCLLDSIAHIAMDKEEIAYLSDVVIPQINIDNGKRLRDKFKQVSMENLNKALELKAADLNG